MIWIVNKHIDMDEQQTNYNSQTPFKLENRSDKVRWIPILNTISRQIIFKEKHLTAMINQI